MADVGVTTVALCWRVERRDGVAVGLTGHDRDLLVDGLVHRAAPGMTPSAIARSGVLEPGAEADTMDVAGALSSAAIGERDLLSGRWDGARVRVFAVDWSDPRDPLTLGEGVIGAVELGEDGFTAELRGASAAFDRPVVEETSPECRATLGDRRCRVAMAARRRFARVAAWLDRVLVRVDAASPGDVLMLRTGPGQLHFAVRTTRGLVHADAALRRVVERPGPVEAPVLGCWRIGEGKSGEVGPWRH